MKAGMVTEKKLVPLKYTKYFHPKLEETCLECISEIIKSSLPVGSKAKKYKSFIW